MPQQVSIYRTTVHASDGRLPQALLALKVVEASLWVFFFMEKKPAIQPVAYSNSLAQGSPSVCSCSAYSNMPFDGQPVSVRQGMDAFCCRAPLRWVLQHHESEQGVRNGATLEQHFAFPLLPLGQQQKLQNQTRPVISPPRPPGQEVSVNR